VGDFGVLEFRKLGKIIERGYEEAVPKVAAWRWRQFQSVPPRS
jgi:hypothetical protein